MDARPGYDWLMAPCVLTTHNMDIVKALQEQRQTIKEITGLLGQLLESNRKTLEEHDRMVEEMGKERITELERRIDEHDHREGPEDSCSCDEWREELNVLKA